MKRACAVTCFALLIWVSAVHAQDRLQRLTPSLRARVQVVIDSAAMQQVPADPLIQKALEGAARGAAEDRIIEVVNALRGRMHTSRNALGTDATEAAIVAGAAALFAGVTFDELHALRVRATNQNVVLPLVAVTDLIERGVMRETALGSVTSLLDARVPTSAYTSLMDQIARDTRQGRRIEDALRSRVKTLIGGSPIRHDKR